MKIQLLRIRLALLGDVVLYFYQQYQSFHRRAWGWNEVLARSGPIRLLALPLVFADFPSSMFDLRLLIDRSDKSWKSKILTAFDTSPLNPSLFPDTITLTIYADLAFLRFC